MSFLKIKNVSKLLFILNIHILGSKDGCFTVTLAPKLKTLLFLSKYVLILGIRELYDKNKKIDTIGEMSFKCLIFLTVLLILQCCYILNPPLLPFYGPGSNVLILQSHYEVAVYFLLLSPQEFLVLI